MLRRHARPWGRDTHAAGPAAATSTTTSGDSRGWCGGDCVVGVSWNNYQEERWAKSDEPAIKAAIEAGGGTYISNDAKSSAETQATNVENLISPGRQRADRPRPGRRRRSCRRSSRRRAGHPGHRLRPPDRGPARVLHHLRQRRGRPDAGRPIFEEVPEGNYVIIKGNQADANADFLRGGSRRSSVTRSRPATSRSSARPTPTTGIRPTPRPTWSSS